MASTFSNPLLLVAICIWAAATFALESDEEQPILVQADAATVDNTSGIATYTGEVLVTQGSLTIAADEVEIFLKDETVIRIIANTDENSTEPAHYEQQLQGSLEKPADMVYADARRITYLVQESRLHLVGDARLQRSGDVFTGEMLHYDIRPGVVNLSRGQEPGDRVNMTIHPKKQSPTKP